MSILDRQTNGCESSIPPPPATPHNSANIFFCGGGGGVRRVIMIYNNNVHRISESMDIKACMLSYLNLSR